MNDFSQGDIVKIVGFRSSFLVVSKNAFIRAAHMFHVIDPDARGCRRIDRLSYGNLMNISDALQGIFEYD